MVGILALKLLGKAVKSYMKNQDKDGDDDNDSKGDDDMIGDSKEKLVSTALNRMLPGREERKENKMSKDNQEEGLGELGALFIKRFGKNRGQPRFSPSGKGRHSNVELEDEKGNLRSGEAIRKSANLYSGERFDQGRVFQAANGKGTNAGMMMARKGTEIKMGFGTAVLAILTVAIGNFPVSQPNETFEIQNLYMAHNGDGASAAATIAVHFTLLAHLALSTFKVGDDPLITGSNYVPLHGYSGPEELAGYVTSFTDPVAISAYNGAAYTANCLLGLGGEAVAKI